LEKYYLGKPLNLLGGTWFGIKKFSTLFHVVAGVGGPRGVIDDEQLEADQIQPMATDVMVRMNDTFEHNFLFQKASKGLRFAHQG
jgi:hypothetical protein